MIAIIVVSVVICGYFILAKPQSVYGCVIEAGTSCSGLSLQNADLVGAGLAGAHLTNVDLSKANLSGANLSNAVLSSVNLSGSNLTNADLTGVDLSRTDLSGADLTGAKGFSPVGLPGDMNVDTMCPDGAPAKYHSITDRAASMHWYSCFR